MTPEELNRLISTLFGSGDDTCPAGEDCPIHHRVYGERMDNDYRQGSLVTYVGRYAVWTDDNDNPDPVDAIRHMAGSIEEFPTMFATTVIEVGEDGTLSQFLTLPGEIDNKTVFSQTHGQWANFKNAHEMIVEGVQNGTLGLSV